MSTSTLGRDGQPDAGPVAPEFDWTLLVSVDDVLVDGFGVHLARDAVQTR
jgi:hypothetical protein